MWIWMADVLRFYAAQQTGTQRQRLRFVSSWSFLPSSSFSWWSFPRCGNNLCYRWILLKVGWYRTWIFTILTSKSCISRTAQRPKWEHCHATTRRFDVCEPCDISVLPTSEAFCLSCTMLCGCGFKLSFDFDQSHMTLVKTTRKVSGPTCCLVSVILVCVVFCLESRNVSWLKV